MGHDESRRGQGQIELTVASTSGKVEVDPGMLDPPVDVLYTISLTSPRLKCEISFCADHEDAAVLQRSRI
jgi:hypothetical protein